MPDNLPAMPLAMCARAHDLAYVLMEARTILEQTGEAMERLKGWESRAAKAIYGEARVHAEGIARHAENWLQSRQLSPGKTANEAADLWRALGEHSYRCEP